MFDIPENAVPIGYEALIQKYNLQVIPHFRSSYIIAQGSKQIIKEDHREVYLFPKKYILKDMENPFSHLEFALKHEGVHLHLIQELFQHIKKSEIESYLKTHPLAQIARRLWYFYEKLTDTTLKLPDLETGSYIDLIDSDVYYTTLPIKSPRHRINDNLLGTVDFCPFIRKTSSLLKFEKKHLEKIAKDLIKQYDEQHIKRAIPFFYSIEAMSSWEIERERPTKQRLARFVSLLQHGGGNKPLSKKSLVDLQNSIVDERFKAKDFRDFQNYVGQEIDLMRQKIHYVCPKAEDVSSMMKGLFACYERMCNANIHPVVIGAVISFGFVFIHPFEDGNGRIHRFLIHYILSKRGFTPPGIIFPVSASMLKDMKLYDEALENISSSIMPFLDYDINSKGVLTIRGETNSLYRYLDYTYLAEYLFHCVEQTIHTDFEQELKFIATYDRTKRELQEIVDMPDKKIDLFIRFVRQNNGTLSSKKQKDYFSMLTSKEMKSMEKTIRSNFKGIANLSS